MMTPRPSQTLMTLTIILSFFMTINATSTNTTYYSNHYIITYTPMEYITAHGDVGVAIVKDFSYINTTSTLPIGESLNIVPSTVSFITELMGFICYIYSYKYILTNTYILVSNTKKIINYLNSLDTTDTTSEPTPAPAPAPAPEFTIPTINIKEDIIDDIDEDDELPGNDNQTIYTTDNGFNLTLFHADGVNVDDVAYTGECYIEIFDGLLFTHNFNTIKFTNPTYKDLLVLTSLTTVRRISQSFTMSDVVIDTDKTYNGVQIIKIDLS